jgi:hypothetical protein
VWWGAWHGSSDAVSWKRAVELLVQVAAHGETNGFEVPCLLIAAKDDLEPDPAIIQSSAQVPIPFIQWLHRCFYPMALDWSVVGCIGCKKNTTYWCLEIFTCLVSLSMYKEG